MADQQQQQQQPGDVQQAPQMGADIANQVAMRAQQMLFRKSIVNADTPRKTPPEVPARGDSISKIPPEIPPKRSSLRKHSVDETRAMPPPPLPQKPASAHNSPMAMAKFAKEPSSAALPSQPMAMRPSPLATPQMVAKFEKLQPIQPPQATVMHAINSGVPLNAAAATAASNNNPKQSPFVLRGAVNSPQLGRKPGPPPPTRTTPIKTAIQASAAAATSSPANTLDDDFSSENALRGIERGLQNMERAMQEQMNLRSLEAAQHKLEGLNFNAPLDFKQAMRGGAGSQTSLDGAGSNQSLIENMRMTLGKNMRSIERGMSMEQMRMDNMNAGGGGGGGLRSMDANSNMRAAIEELKSKAFAEMGGQQQRPVENHMKSLDRSLPLELQYSRHHRTQSHEIAEQLRQTFANNAANIMGGSGGMVGAGIAGGVRQSQTGSLSRDDVRMRRRSSHDENQLRQEEAGKVYTFYETSNVIYIYYNYNTIFGATAVSWTAYADIALVGWIGMGFLHSKRLYSILVANPYLLRPEFR